MTLTCRVQCAGDDHQTENGEMLQRLTMSLTSLKTLSMTSHRSLSVCLSACVSLYRVGCRAVRIQINSNQLRLICICAYRAKQAAQHAVKTQSSPTQ